MKLANERGLAPKILWLDIDWQSMVIEFLDESGPGFLRGTCGTCQVNP
jgi:hypothetical protein